MFTILFVFCLCIVVMSQECLEIQSKIILLCKDGEIINDPYCGSDDYYIGQGGLDAEETEFPHMALLTHGKVYNESEFGCGGSLISEKYVLTATHCSATSGRVPVSFGLLNRRDMYKMPQKNVRGIQKIIKHPEYKPPAIYHDIAWLELRREIVISITIRPACLQVTDILDDRGYVTGWGALGHRRKNADILQSGDSGGPMNIRNRIIEKKKKWASLTASWYPKDREGQNRTLNDKFGTIISITRTRTGRNRTESELLKDNFVGEQVEEYSRTSLLTVLGFAVSVFAG